MTDRDMKLLDDTLAQVAERETAVPDALMASILRDAAQVQPRPFAAAPRQSLWDTVLDLIGGWPAVSGLAAAGVVGIWIGVSPPAGFETLTGPYDSTSVSVNLFGTDTLSTFGVEEDF